MLKTFYNKIINKEWGYIKKNNAEGDSKNKHKNNSK